MFGFLRQVWQLCFQREMSVKVPEALLSADSTRKVKKNWRPNATSSGGPERWGWIHINSCRRKYTQIRWAYKLWQNMLLKQLSSWIPEFVPPQVCFCMITEKCEQIFPTAAEGCHPKLKSFWWNILILCLNEIQHKTSTCKHQGFSFRFWISSNYCICWRARDRTVTK